MQEEPLKDADRENEPQDINQQASLQEDEYVFIKSFTRNGITYYASNYGKKAFKIKKKY